MSKKTRVTKNCVICGKSFEVKLSHSTYIQCCSIICGTKFKQIKFDKSIENKMGGTIPEWLTEHYVRQLWTYRHIINELHINLRTLMRYMKEYDIPIRYGSDAIKVQWLNAKERRLKQSVLIKEIHSTFLFRNGKDSPLWKGGAKTYRGKDWNSVKKLIHQRDNNTCQQCGVTENGTLAHRLEVHHIVSFRNKKYFNEMTNLVLLCHECHKRQLSHKL